MEGLVATFNSILKISELEANTNFRSFEPCDITAILTDLVDFYEPLAGEKNITLTFLPSPLEGESRVGGGAMTESSRGTPLPNLPPQGGKGLIVRGEKNLLTQAFANVFDNAIKFTPEGGTISLACVQKEGHVEVVVGDSGPGIPQEFRNKVFEKFFRLEQSRGSKGNGLGLSLVAAIARIHNAKIILEDNAPGLRVKISFTSNSIL
jgi:signal transduction histidine kinase